MHQKSPYPYNPQIAQVQAQIQSAQERRLADNDPKDDELTHFRQRAAVIARKKDAAAEKLNELRSEKATIEEDIKVSLLRHCLHFPLFHSSVPCMEDEDVGALAMGCVI